MRQESKIIQALIECFPNDADLGREIRKLYKPKDNDTDRKEHSHQDDRRGD